ncbi:hypothetical protein UFOVP53_148 [uncultured Caudovirales phage]|uniref:Uncharacterized protein n=1 Tax=uncultured Caudovirales phage TaxID=2100421 RepID=A0A6J5KSL5_9CAUD|nr:hypothetical protein UFOVP53_148 [uncultured Caudovirales phage]
MAGKKGKRDDSEDWRRFQKFQEENTALKKEVTKLRKLVKEAYVDSLNEKLKRQEKGLEPRKPLCEICGNDDLAEIDINRADGTFMFHLCNNCGSRSAVKRKKEVKKKEVKNEDSELN